MEIEHICSIIVDAAFKIHKDIGSGLLESAYEVILAAKLQSTGLTVDRQVPIDIEYDAIRLPSAFRVDLLFEKRIILEIKSVGKPHQFDARVCRQFWHTTVQGWNKTLVK